MNFPDSELWNFSEQTYALPEVEGICLKLQNEYDADINIILYCLWVAEKSVELSQGDIGLLIQTTEPWQKTILRPLRDARKMMKQHIIAMPSDILDQTVSNLTEMEINAEHMSQLALEKTINFKQPSSTDNRSTIEYAGINLTNYLQQLESTSFIENISTELTTILNAVFQDTEAVQIALMHEA